MTCTVHECLELWCDPPAWQAHLLQQVCSLTRCRVGLYFEMANDNGHMANRLLEANDVGWSSSSERHTVVEGLSEKPLRFSPLWAAFADRLALDSPVNGLTARQDSVIDRSDWQASEMYDRHVRPTRLGEAMLSAVWLPHLGSWSAWSLVTDRDDAAVSPRAERIARLLHGQIARLIGTSLSTWRDRTVAPLSDTRRRTLEALLMGETELGIAERTSRSRSAVHEHVTELYRHFGVRSRGELAACFLRRRPVSAGGKKKSPALDDWLDRPWSAVQVRHSSWCG